MGNALPEFLKPVVSNPLVSVLLPAYNAERYIRLSIESILRQSYEKLEIIVIDDGSTDGTAEIVKEIAAREQRLVYVRKTNSGIVDALNAGLKLATGTLVARQDADDISVPARIAKQVEFLQERPGCIAVSCAHLHIDEDGEFTGSCHYPENRGSGNYTSLPAWEPYLPHPFLMMRADIMKRLAYRYTFHCEDSDLYWRAVGYGGLENLSDILGLYRIHTASISGANVLEGRIQAVFSQLSAISAGRRDLMQPDLDFNFGLLKACREARSLEAMLRIFEKQLRPRELEFLRVASIVKLIELSSVRPYSLDKEDIAFLKKYVALSNIRGKENRRNVRRAIRGHFRRKGLVSLIRFYAGWS